MKSALKISRRFFNAAWGTALFLTASMCASGDTITGDLTVTGMGWFKEGIDIGTNGLVTGEASEGLLNWSAGPGSTAGTVLFDIKRPVGSYMWRDSMGTTVTNKMELNDSNVLSLYNSAGTIVGISLSPNDGRIKISGTGSGIYSGTTPLLTLDSAGGLIANKLTLTDYTSLRNELLHGNASEYSLSLTMTGGTASGYLNCSTAISGGAVSGPNAVAMSGGNASGEFSSALSNGSVSGSFSTAISYGNATGSYAVAMSYGEAAAYYSTAMSGGDALYDYSTAMSGGSAGYYYDTAMSGGTTSGGYATAASGGIATGDHSTALSYGRAYANNATAMSDSYATGFGSTAMSASQASGSQSTSMSVGDARGTESTAMSRGTALGEASVAMSRGTANGGTSTAMSDGSANADYSVAMSQGQAGGIYSTAISKATAAGAYSFAAGLNSTAYSYGSVAFGRYNAAVGTPGAWIEPEPLFVIGNGTAPTAATNALLTRKNGQTTLTNKAWKANSLTTPSTANSNLEALVVEGHARLKGKVYLDQVQGDIPMYEP